MADAPFKLGVLKLGCIGAAPLLDLLLDERADREDLDTRSFTSGAKLDPASCETVTAQCLAYEADLVLIVAERVVACGPPDEALTPASLADAFGVVIEDGGATVIDPHHGHEHHHGPGAPHVHGHAPGHDHGPGGHDHPHGH